MKKTLKEKFRKAASGKHDYAFIYDMYNKIKSAIENFDSNIRDLVHSNFRCYSPDSIDYDLRDYVFQMQYDWCLNLDE